jgi:hypothetical protein
MISRLAIVIAVFFLVGCEAVRSSLPEAEQVVTREVPLEVTREVTREVGVPQVFEKEVTRVIEVPVTRVIEIPQAVQPPAALPAPVPQVIQPPAALPALQVCAPAPQVPNVGAQQPVVANIVVTSHYERLRALDPVYRNYGVETWLRQAGFYWDRLVVVARQPEEETFGTEILVSGIQVDVVNLTALWPGVMTTDQYVPESARCYQPTASNPSRLCTNVYGFTGRCTLWVDGSNWPVLQP